MTADAAPKSPAGSTKPGDAPATIFLREPEPERGVATDVRPGIRRIVASNKGVMTYHGTNTYLIEGADGLTVLDPGPDEAAHVDAIVSATGGRVARILITHAHSDHVGAAAALKAATGAPIYGYEVAAGPDFTPDVPLADGDTIAGLTAIHTPGHAADHLCFATGDGLLFTGDHVMSWSTTVVGPPRGDMRAYFRSLRLLLERDDAVYLPGHGPALPDPHPYVRGLLRYREAREEAIAAAISGRAITAGELMDTLYGKSDPTLRRAAERNVNAHLLKLEAEGRAERVGDGWRGRRAGD